jgi:hypothetical protein
MDSSERYQHVDKLKLLLELVNEKDIKKVQMKPTIDCLSRLSVLFGSR